MFENLLRTILDHKAVALIIVIVIFGGYFGYTKSKNSGQGAHYVLAAVQKGTIVVSVSGSGQVSASNQVDIKPKASGDITYLGMTITGQEVKSGAVLAQLDATDAYKSVRDAQANLDSAKLSLQKLEQPADQLSILQAQDALTQAQKSKQTAQDNLKKAHDDGFNDVSNAFLDLPNIMTGLNGIISGNDHSTSQNNLDYYSDTLKIYDETGSAQYRNDAYNTYNAARATYDKNFDDYKSISRYSDTDTIESLINETYNTARNISDAIKSTNNLIQFYKDELTQHNLKSPSLTDTHLSNLNSYTGKINSQLSNLLSDEQTIQNDKDAITSADQSIAEKTASFEKLQAGADPLDIQSQQLSIQQKQNALFDARQKLTDYTVRAPFDGVIAKINGQKGDSISAGAALATLITKQRLAEISLNEVDVAKVKVGQKVTLTFDAISDLNLTGEVAEVDAIGTVSQGVVTYNIEIVFDTQDDRVKPGMSVSAAIMTDVKQDVLLVPNSAVKFSGNTNYVEILANSPASNQLSASASNGANAASLTPPTQQTVQIGLSNDSMTEIISGLKEGDEVVTQTITANSTTQTQTQSGTGGLRIPGLGGGGNAVFRRD